MNEHHIHDLFRQYFDHSLTKDQLNTLIQAMDNLSEEDFLLLMEALQPEDTGVVLDLYAFKEKLIFQRVKVALEEDRQVRPIDRHITRKVVLALATAAAAVALIFYFFPFTRDKKALQSDHLMVNDVILPQNIGIIVSSSGGKKEEIHSDKSRTYHDLGLEVRVDENNEVVFRSKPVPGREREEITFSNPKGATAKLVLSDSSIVYLNSNSTIRYPSTFAAQKRHVHIQGEAYFSVKHDKSRPFTVAGGGQQIQVLGTEFNVNCYTPNHVITSLITGKVQIDYRDQHAALRPGEQAFYDLAKNNFTVQKSNNSEVLAWKNGRFSFTEDNIHQVLDKLNDWYQIDGSDVRYQSNDRFSGSIKRTEKLSDVLRQLEKISSYKFKIENRRVIVMK